MRRVMTLDVRRGIRLRQSRGLRVRKRDAELDTRFAHGAEDRIAGAVDDSINRALPIARERLAQDSDDRHAAADAGLEADRETAFAGLAKNLAAMLREQRLVAGHDVLPSRK